MDLIIGYGEIGKAIHECYGKNKKNVIVYDIKQNSKKNKHTPINFMHICFDCTDQNKFIKEVLRYDEKYYPNHIVIHATTIVGTTAKIYDILQKGLESITFSPCTGKHPDLYKSIHKIFFKFYSTLPTKNEDVTGLFNHLFNKIYYNCFIDELEFSKLLCTTKYGKAIGQATEIGRVCEKHGFDYRFVNTVWDSNYNQGYSKLGMPQFIRPVLKPCSGKIGGHCIIPNIKKIKDSKKCL